MKNRLKQHRVEGDRVQQFMILSLKF